MTVETETFTSTRITVNVEAGFAVLSWDGRGLVTLKSSGGNGEYRWNATGRETPKFLAMITRDYTGGNLLGTRYTVLDVKATIEAAKRRILRLRRKGVLDADEARCDWEWVKGIHDDHSITTYIHNSLTPEAYECHCTMENPRWVRFWECVWVPHIRPELKRLASV